MHSKPWQGYAYKFCLEYCIVKPIYISNMRDILCIIVVRNLQCQFVFKFLKGNKSYV